MARQRQYRTRKPHYALLVNRQATDYQTRPVQNLTRAIKAHGGFFTLYEPESGMDLALQARVAAGLRRASQSHPAPFFRGGKITALISCGGDGTFNLVARAALEAEIPVGLLPLGRTNNIARFLYESTATDTAISKIMAGSYRKIDSATAVDQLFFGSAGLGFIPRLAHELKDRSLPRFGIGWSQLGSKAAAQVTLRKTVLKVDAFRFEISPIILNVNLLPYSCGLPLSPASLADDGMAEIIIDHAHNAGNFSSFTRQICKRKYLYGDDVRLYRGKVIVCQPVKGRSLYLDGEILELPNDILEISISPKQLKVFC